MHTNSMEESTAWGAGYDAGQAGLKKAIETAKLLERQRIIKLLEKWLGDFDFHYSHQLELIALIKEENK